MEADAETADLLDYAAHCHAVSDGKFDVTSGVLRRVWKFDGGDRAAQLGTEAGGVHLLVNFGGDSYATGARRDGGAWRVAIENVTAGDAPPVIKLRRGGVTASGDARRFLLKDGVRYGHILDPRSGWPAKDALRSVTVLEGNCTQAGCFRPWPSCRDPAPNASSGNTR